MNVLQYKNQVYLENMRILYFSRDYGTATTTFIRNEVEWFAEKHECLYLCQKVEDSGEQQRFVRVVPFRRNSLMNRVRWLLWKADISCNFYSQKYAAAINKVVQEFRPDIIHCHFAFEALMLIDNIDHAKYPVILHFHGYDASMMMRKRSYIKRMSALLRLLGVHAISCNRYFVKRLSTDLGVPENKFFILNYGIDTGFFNSGSAGEGGTFVQVASLTEKKGHEYLLRSFSLLHKKNSRYRLIIAGDGPLRKSLLRLCCTLGIDGAVKFAGTVTAQEVKDILARSDVFVHHSVTAADGDMEGMPNSILEAMSMGLPVVSTRHSGIPELVEEGVNGYLVEERDVEGFAREMEKAVDLGRLKANRDKVERLYTRTTHNKRLEHFYGAIMNGEPTLIH